jgi:cholesterol transport system auxiliary component
MLIRSLKIGWLSCAALLLLSACAAAPSAAPRVYDFGPGTLRPTANVHSLPDLVLGDVEAAPALDGTAMLYRLGYAEVQQLRPYAQARWSMPAALLLRQRLREQLGQRRSVLSQADAGAARALVLRVELEEFSQLFDAVDASQGLIRVRVTLSQPGLGVAAKTLAQTSLVVQQPSTSADAPGGVRALALAADAMMAKIDQWVEQHSSGL